MESYLHPGHYDLVTPDGFIETITTISETELSCTLKIENISPAFVGFKIDPAYVFFNIKSTLAQLGINGIEEEIELDPKNYSALLKIRITAIGPLAIKFLPLLKKGAYIGKLFAADPRRRVRDPDYLSRMFGRSDRKGRPLLSLGGMQGSSDLVLDKVEGRTIAYISLKKGVVKYDDAIEGFIPTLGKALCHHRTLRDLLQLHQVWKEGADKIVLPNEILLVKTLPLHIRTVFARVVDPLLPRGYRHTSACILQPDTTASGDIYEFYGHSDLALSDIPLEFYTLEPHREYVFFSDRDQLQTSLETPQNLFKAFETAPDPKHLRASVFVVKGEQLQHLKKEDWILREAKFQEFPGMMHGVRQALMVERYIEQQPEYPFLRSIDEGLISSQGVLLSRYFPSPMMQRMLLSNHVQLNLKGLYFYKPSANHSDFFSHEDRALLSDLWKFAIPTYWVDEVTGQILQYVQKPDKSSGIFVPQDKVEHYLHATVFGVYGSNLVAGHFESELKALLKGVCDMKEGTCHPLLHPHTPLALVTGGGPGAMEVGNRVAKSLGILSCAHIVDFSVEGAVINEQHQNPHIEAKMTYRLDKLVERQADFNLDIPIFVMGGIGTDFEYCLEEVRRKTGSIPPTPILLFGEPEYWRSKITSRFQCNLDSGTIKGSEWISNCLYCIQNADEGLYVLSQFFNNELPIGHEQPPYKQGFAIVKDLLKG